jgi:hypothetical protein
MASPKLIALFFAFAMVAAALQPSEAARVVQAQQQAFKPAAAAGQEAAEKVALTDQQAAAGVPVPRPSTTTTPPAGAIIGLLQPLIPPPGSSLPLQAGTGTQPTECMTPLAGMLPCTDYLTNITVLTPPGECCDGLRSVIRDAPICLCHGMNGDMDQFLPKPVDGRPHPHDHPPARLRHRAAHPDALRLQL